MNNPYILSVILLAAFVCAIALRVVLLRRKGVKAFVFGATDKSDFLMAPFVLLIIYTACANTFGWPVWGPLVRPFWQAAAPSYVGLILCAAAVVGIICTLASFGNSFRVGIDEQKPGGLVTGGMFRLSRNPIYVCFDTFFIGLFLVHRNIIIAVAVIGFALLIHRQILREEAFLRKHYGDEYEAYCKKVRRYL